MKFRRGDEAIRAFRGQCMSLDRRTLVHGGIALIGSARAGFTVGKTLEKETAKEVSSQRMDNSIYVEPYTDVDEWRDAPVRHRYVHGGFKGTELLYSMYFPPK